MATTITAYNHLSHLIAADLDLSAATIKVALVTSAYTFSAAHTIWADASGSEVASGAGYTTGGETLGGKALTLSSVTTKFDATDLTWTALTKTFRRAVCYASGTIMALTNPVLFSVLFDSTPADISIPGIDFVLIWNASGILTIG